MADICTNCGSKILTNTQFCTSCGSQIKSPSSSQGGFCGSCGTALESKFSPCPKCGHVKTTFTPPPQSSPQHHIQSGKPSAAWYLLPIFFSIIGGIIAWACIKDRDPSMAKNNLILGIVLTVLPIIVIVIAGVLGSPALGGFDAMR